ncbi:MAG: hypothetical protein JKY98_00310 [Gammaproteobacteria bacterium]|nr:hypothetical protein [Gammaproteobacteria bacterium]
MIDSRRTLRFYSVLSASVLALALSNFSLAADNWINGRTPDGQPDLQGVWVNKTITPMERPAALADKPFLSADEVTDLENRAAERRANRDENIVIEVGGGGGRFISYNSFWTDPGSTVLSTGQTSLIVDPPSGLAPIRPEAEATRDYNFAHVEEHWTYNTVWDRCITRGIPGSMLPAGYNNAYQILQSPDYVTIKYEMIHDVRIIPLTKDAHIDSKIKLWMGDSIAHWEGETLVVDTTNYNDRGIIASSSAGARLKGVPVSDQLHVVERFTRVSEDTIIWSARITDPVNFTRPFTISMPLTRDGEYTLYEYACHEGNRSVANILSAGKVAEQQQ